MASYKRFEDLPVWVDAKNLFVQVFACCEKGKLKSDFGMKDQMRRAAASVSNNIAEGFEQNNNKVFYNYLRIAKGSCGELRNQILLCSEVGLLSVEESNHLNDCAVELSKQLSSFMKYLKADFTKK